MNLIWGVIIVFGLVSLLILVVGIWTQFDMSKEQRQERSFDGTKTEKKP